MDLRKEPEHHWPSHIWASKYTNDCTVNGYMDKTSTTRVGINNKDTYTRSNQCDPFVDLEIPDIFSLYSHVQDHIQSSKIKMFSIYLSLLKDIEKYVPEFKLNDDMSACHHTSVWLSNYFNPKRCYHNFTHPFNMLEDMEKHSSEICESLGISKQSIFYTIMQLGILWHDEIMLEKNIDRPGANEEETAELAMHAMETDGVPYTITRQVADIIIATAHKEFKGYYPGVENVFENIQDHMQATVCDLDLLPLAADKNQWERNRLKIRKEVMTMDPDKFKHRSIFFAKSFLNREAIYSTPPFKQYEERARMNLESLLT